MFFPTFVRQLEYNRNPYGIPVYLRATLKRSRQMIALITIPFFLASMVLDMLARKRNDDAMAAIFQPLTTFIVIVAALTPSFRAA